MKVQILSENDSLLREKAAQRLMDEVEKGWASAEEDGWLTLDEVEKQIDAQYFGE